MNKNMKCDWIRYRENQGKTGIKEQKIPIIRKRETLALQGACDPLQIPGQQ